MLRVKARLTNDSLEQGTDPPNPPESDFDFRALSVLFDSDPLIMLDDKGWFLSSSELDAADDEGQPWALRDVVDRLMVEMNGASLLLRSDSHGKPVRLTYEFDGRNYTGVSGRVYSMFGYSLSLDGLDATDAGLLLSLAQTEPWVRRVLELLQHVDRDWVWFDLWRIWDVMKGHFPNGQFKPWVLSLHQSYDELYVSFENSANDPELGDNRRHSTPAYRRRTTRAGDVPPALSSTVAMDFVKTVSLRWMQQHFGLELKHR